MTRILFMHQSSDIGGGSYCLLNIIKDLSKETWYPIVVLKDNGPLADALKDLGIEVAFFPEMISLPYNETLFKPANIRAYIKASKKHESFKRLLHHQKIDVVYLNNMMLAPYLKDAKEFGCKTIMHVREHWPLNEHRQQLKWIRNIVYKNCDCLIAINKYSASIFPDKDATIVYDWVDMKSRYKAIPLNDIFGEDMTGKKVLLFTGGQSIIKGADYVVNAFSNNIKGEEYRLLILGIDKLKTLSGWKHRVKLFLEHFGYYYYDKHLQEIIKSDPRIKLFPPIYELSDIIRQAHCFVSFFSIPHANLALAENLILGNPCIAADTEESREYSADGKYAKLVNPIKDLKHFSDELTTFLDHIEYWKAQALDGAPVIAELFGKNKNIIRLNKCLNNLALK